MTAQAAIEATGAQEAKRRKIRQALVAYSFIAPNFLGFAIFTLGPIILAMIMAFMEWDGSNPWKFVGIQNFLTIFGDDRFLASLKNTVVYSIFTVPLTPVSVSVPERALT